MNKSADTIVSGTFVHVVSCRVVQQKENTNCTRGDDHRIRATSNGLLYSYTDRLASGLPSFPSCGVRETDSPGTTEFRPIYARTLPKINKINYTKGRSTSVATIRMQNDTPEIESVAREAHHFHRPVATLHRLTFSFFFMLLL